MYHPILSPAVGRRFWDKRIMGTRIDISAIQTGYLLVGVSAAAAFAHFFIQTPDVHAHLLSASFTMIFVCIFLGFQVQPREMRPTLFAFFGFWLHLACWFLRNRFVAPLDL
jgi:hypothetical protein